MSDQSLPASVPASPFVWRRLAAALYDLLPLLGLWIIGSGLWMLAFHRGDSVAQLASALETPVEAILRDVWLLLITAAYFVVSWTRVGATIGMRAWKLRVVDGGGRRIDGVTACKRFVLAVLSLAVLGCGFWYAWFDAGRLTVHDRLCGTRVVRL